MQCTFHVFHSQGNTLNRANKEANTVEAIITKRKLLSKQFQDTKGLIKISHTQIENILSPEARITVELDGIVSHRGRITPCSEQIAQSICNLEQEQKQVSGFFFLWGQSHESEQHKKPKHTHTYTTPTHTKQSNQSKKHTKKNPPEQAPREQRLKIEKRVQATNTEVF